MFMFYPDRKDPVIVAGHWFADGYEKCSNCGTPSKDLYADAMEGVLVDCEENLNEPA